MITLILKTERTKVNQMNQGSNSKSSKLESCNKESGKGDAI